jgi:bifunctional enzyme CysN/CysC
MGGEQSSGASLYLAQARREWTGATVWLTGLPASGKTTIGDAVGELLLAAGYVPYRLDGDVLRRGLTADLGFDEASRHENVRRAAHAACMLAETGVVVVASLISPYASDRARAREIHVEAGVDFIEVFVDTPLHECERRDPRGLYARARAGQIKDVTGIDDPYETPADPDLVLPTLRRSVAEAAAAVMAALQARGVANARPSRLVAAVSATR